MTDRRRQSVWCRAWRATVGRAWPAVRHLKVTRMWAWWTARGVIPRWQLLFVYVLVVVAGATGMTVTQDAVNDNCVRIHRIVQVGGAIIASGRNDLEDYRADGLLTEQQYRRALADVDDRLARWRSADCPPDKKTP